MDEAKVAVVMLPFPFQGHMNQFLHLSRIISSFDVPVHLVGTPVHNQKARLRTQGWDPLSISNLHFHDFDVPSFDAPPPDPNDPDKFPLHLLAIGSSLFSLMPPTEAIVHKLAATSKRVIFIIDFIMVQMPITVYSNPKVESYCFHVFSAFSLHYFSNALTGKPVIIHGEPVKDVAPVDTVIGKMTLDYCKKYLFESNFCGNIYNSCKAIEGEFFDFMTKDKVHCTDKHWALGPFVMISIPERKTSNKYLEWLDKQPPNSVMYVAFGTSTTFSDEQIEEIAVGLEKSGHNFMWALRYADKADLSEDQTREPPLPNGFEKRVEGRGIIIRDWAPQLEILAHPSTGGFMSHCGWNSTLEAICMGTPVATWSMHSEQPLNAMLITEVLRTGMPVRECKVQYNEIVKSEVIEGVVRRLMGTAEGHEMRQRAAELSSAVKESASEGGEVDAERARFIAHITR